MATKKQIKMNGETFNECWWIEGLDVKETSNVVVNFINDFMINVFVDGKKVWSVIKGVN